MATRSLPSSPPSRAQTFWSALFWGLICAATLPGYLTPKGLWWVGGISLLPVLGLLFNTANLPYPRWHSLLASVGMALGVYGASVVWIIGVHPLAWVGLSTVQSAFAAGLAWACWAGSTALRFIPLGLLWGSPALIQRMSQRWGGVLLPRPVMFMLLVTPIWLLGWALTIQGITPLDMPWVGLHLSQTDNPWMPWIAHQLSPLPFPVSGLIETSLIAAMALLTGFIGNTLKGAKAFARLRLPAVWAITGSLLLITLSHEAPRFWKPPLPHPDATLSLAHGVLRPVAKSNSIAEIRGEARVSLRAAYQAAIPTSPHTTPLIVLLPEENLIAGWVSETNPWQNADVASWQAWANQHQTAVLMGASTIDPNHGEAPIGHNSIVAIVPATWYSGPPIVPMTHKRWLVPFGETVPTLGGLLPPDWLSTVLYTVGNIHYDFPYAAGNAKLLTLPTPDGPLRIGGLVCVEVIDGFLAKSLARQGADVLVVVANTAWFQGSARLTQQLNAQWLAHLQWRAWDAQRPIVYADNRGKSAILQP